MPNVNPGPASTATPSATSVLAPASQPNFGNLYQGSNALRLLAFQQALPISGTGDFFLPLINCQRLALLPAASSIITCNPGAFVNGVFTPGTSVACVWQLFTAGAGGGTALCGSTTSTMTGATALLSIQTVASTGLGFYNTAVWGAGSTLGLGGAFSGGIYFHCTTASAATATQMDLYIYGLDLT